MLSSPHTDRPRPLPRFGRTPTVPLAARDPPRMTFAALRPPVLHYADLRARGLTRRQIDRAVRDGRLVRVRKGRYVEPPADVRALDAARQGGRLDCVSLLGALGVFVQDRHGLHIAVEPGSSRLPNGAARHWRQTTSDARFEIIQALVQACRCQSVPAAIATLDSAWHLRLVDSAGIDEVFARLPKRYRILRRRLDPRCESGPESLVRLMLWRLGIGYALQVRIRGVGRVDFVVAGRLIVECDSRAFHGDWAQRREDYRRDLAAAVQGFLVVRITAEDILYRPDDVFLALRGAVSALGVKRGAHNSSSARSVRR